MVNVSTDSRKEKYMTKTTLTTTAAAVVGTTTTTATTTTTTTIARMTKISYPHVVQLRLQIAHWQLLPRRERHQVLAVLDPGGRDQVPPPGQAPLVHLGRLEAHDGEDDDAGEHGRAAVGEGDDEGVASAVVVHGVVRGVSDQAAERQAKGEEDLKSSYFPKYF